MSTRLHAAVFTVALTACGGGGGDEARICQTFQDCINFSDAQVDQCVTSLERSTARRAIAECAECMSEASCSEIDDGQCADECELALVDLEVSSSGVEPGLKLTNLTGDEAVLLCEWTLEAWGGPNLEFSCDGYSVSTGTVAECAAAFDDVKPGCPATADDWEDCIDATYGDPCYLTAVTACGFYASCWDVE